MTYDPPNPRAEPGHVPAPATSSDTLPRRSRWPLAGFLIFNLKKKPRPVCQHQPGQTKNAMQINPDSGQEPTPAQPDTRPLPASEQAVVVKKKVASINAVGTKKKVASINEVLTEYLTECRRNYNGRTRQSYETRVKHMHDFLSQAGVIESSICTLDLVHAQQFINYCRELKYVHQYIVRHVQVLKLIGSFAVINRHLTVNPFGELKLKKRERRDIRHLTTDQINLLTTLPWTDTLQPIVDLFIWSMHTGLHYRDAQTLTAADVRPGIDGRLWLFKERGKYADSQYFDNQPAQVVPLSPTALALISKYGGVDRLPKISNVNYNKHLKNIGQAIGFEGLTVKIARKTFTDLMLNNLGASVEAVAAMLGHASTKHVAYYGRASERRIATEVRFDQPAPPIVPEPPAPAEPVSVTPRRFGIILGDRHHTQTA